MFSLLLAIIYLAFISLGLPDSLLGSAWPVIYPEMDVPMSWSGIIFMIISLGTVISSLNSDRLTRLLGTGKITAISVAITAAALFGFSISHSFPLLCLWAIPYGLGAGSIDAALNNYVALHYASRHMSWLHCMWGVGASVGPYIMNTALTHGYTWNTGYRWISMIQIILAIVLFLSLPLWKRNADSDNETTEETHISAQPLSLKAILSLPGAKAVMLCFFCYCALEQTVGLWASSYLVSGKGVDEVTAAGFASLFFLGVTVGRAVSGFITFQLNDAQMIRLGESIIILGILCIILPFGTAASYIGLIIIGVGCAPIYPSIIHSTPQHFGTDKSQAVIGVQMASAYVGTSFMPPVFGWIANHITIHLFPFYLLFLLIVMLTMHEILCRKTSNTSATN